MATDCDPWPAAPSPGTSSTSLHLVRSRAPAPPRSNCWDAGPLPPAATFPARATRGRPQPTLKGSSGLARRRAPEPAKYALAHGPRHRLDPGFSLHRLRDGNLCSAIGYNGIVELDVFCALLA